MKKQYLSIVLICTIIVATLCSCSLAKVDGDEEGVFIKQPLFFGKGGVDETPLQKGSKWKVFTTKFITFKTTPIIHPEKFDDIVSSDNTPIDVTAYITTQIQSGKTPILVKNFGTNWFQNNIQVKFRSLIRDRISKYPMRDLTANRQVLQDIEIYIQHELEKEVKQKQMPIDVVSVDINQCLPNKDVITAMNQTSVMIQEKQTQERRVEAEQIRAKAEHAKAIADKEYVNTLGLSSQQFLMYQWIKVAEKNGASIDVVLDPNATNMWNIRR